MRVAVAGMFAGLAWAVLDFDAPGRAMIGSPSGKIPEATGFRPAARGFSGTSEQPIGLGKLDPICRHARAIFTRWFWISRESQLS